MAGTSVVEAVSRVMKLLSGLALLTAGSLLWNASWQRWAGVCGRGPETALCTQRQDHRFDFLPPGEPWEPLGTTARLGGSALLVLAGALLLLTIALAGRRIGPVLVAVVTALAFASQGIGILRSDEAGMAVDPDLPALTQTGWLLGPVVLLVWLAVVTRGWDRASAIVLLMGSPIVAYLSYAMGSFDAGPWWEAIMGSWIALAGVCLLVAATRGGSQRPAIRQAEVSSEPIAAM
jgi:hypothetical protein